MLLYHALHKTFDDFEEVFEYRFDGKDGTLIETDKELKPRDVVILEGISEYAIVVTSVWEEGGKRYFSHDTAEEIVVRARKARSQK